MLKLANPKKSLNIITPKLNPKIIVTNKAFLNLLNGLLILKIKIKPVRAIIDIANVDTSCFDKFESSDINTILNTTVKPDGIALLMILAKKLLSIFSLLGSKAKMNDGIPIVNILDNDA